MDDKVECSCCAKCCTYLTFSGIKFQRGMDRMYQEYYRKHGCKCELDKTGWVVTVPMRCPHLTEDNKCDLHVTRNKPMLCKIFVGQGDGLMDVPKDCMMAEARRKKE